jgi:hypothetical protein
MLPLAGVVFIDLRVAESLTTAYESEVATVGSSAPICRELSVEVVIGRSICVPSSRKRVPFRNSGVNP